MKFFVDTSGWISLFAQNDRWHEMAQESLRKLQDEPLQMVTSDYVFDETMTHLRLHYGLPIAERCGRYLLSSPMINFNGFWG